jgi:hypothetical protein
MPGRDRSYSAQTSDDCNRNYSPKQADFACQIPAHFRDSL